MTVAVPPLALSLENPDWTLLRNLGIGLVVVLWLATAYWTFKDARRRIEDPWLVALATVVGFFHRSSGRSSTCSSGRPSTSRTRASASSRSRPWRSGSGNSISAAPSVVPASSLVSRLSRVYDAAEVGVPDCGQPLESLWQVCPYCATEIPPASAGARGHHVGAAPAADDE